MKRDDPQRQAQDVLVPIAGSYEGYPPLGTDELTAKNWNVRTARVGVLAGRYQALPLGDQFPDDANALIPARDVLTHLVFRVIARSFVPWREELNLDDAPQRSIALSRATSAASLMRYKARPLNGVWSTSPYLHNGSVLNMVELLKPPGERLRTFRVGTTEYDPATLGYRNDGPSEFDTSKPGNGNLGHEYGSKLTADEKAALIEYIKTL